MNTRIVYGLLVSGLLVGACGLGFGVGYGWPRNPAEDSAAKRLLSLTDKIAVDVVGIQHSLADGAAQCRVGEIGHQPAIQPITEAAQAKTHAPKGTETVDVTAQQRAQAEEIVMRGISAGRWTDNDARDLRTAMSELSGDQKQSIVTPLLQAVNAQQVKLEVEYDRAL